MRAWWRPVVRLACGSHARSAVPREEGGCHGDRNRRGSFRSAAALEGREEDAAHLEGPGLVGAATVPFNRMPPSGPDRLKATSRGPASSVEGLAGTESARHTVFSPPSMPTITQSRPRPSPRRYSFDSALLCACVRVVDLSAFARASAQGDGRPNAASASLSEALRQRAEYSSMGSVVPGT